MDNYTHITRISKVRFDAFCYIRAPHLRLFSIEVDWFEAYNQKVLGVVVLELVDKDYGYVILGRDNRRVFRCIETCSEFYKSQEEATNALLNRLKKYENDGKELYSQGDEKSLPHDILLPQVQIEKLHRYFRLITEKPGYDAAKKLLQEIAYSYVDVDGTYIKDFQTTGFNARLWELYLYIYLHTAGFHIDSAYQAPDYNVSLFGRECCIEAVSVNPNPSFDEQPPKSPRDVFRYCRDYMPIKFGSSLYSKLQKKYWLQPHVKGKPFVIAIHDYHMDATVDNLGSMTWSRGALMDYLYGQRLIISETSKDKFEYTYLNDGTPEMEEIKEHAWKGKSIPSNFFSLPDAENISAILFSNNATVTTFNRMGHLAKISEEEIKMIRNSIVFNPDSRDPVIQVADLDNNDYEESWAEGLIMYHNPRAKYPVDSTMFPDISHVFFDLENNSILADMKLNHVITSFTMVMIPKPN